MQEMAFGRGLDAEKSVAPGLDEERGGRLDGVWIIIINVLLHNVIYMYVLFSRVE